MFDRLITTLLFALVCFFSPAQADVVKPALVEISVFNDGTYDVELRTSLEALLTGINAQYKNTQEAPNAEEYDHFREMAPEDLRKAFEPFHQTLLDNIEIRFDSRKSEFKLGEIVIPERGYTKVPRTSIVHLIGKVPSDAQSMTWYYPARFGDNAVRVRQVNKTTEEYHWSEHQWLRHDKPSQPFSLTEVANPRSTFDVMADYLVAGIEHIIPMGLDHILFILGLYLFSTKIKPLLWQVTMFTLAHTITLGLAMYGIVQLSASVVEPLIALSIAYVGIENVMHKKLENSRLALVFAFGLLHGMGFASVLTEFGMPQDAFAAALIAFNIGVEVGQLAVITLAFVLTGLWFRHKSWYRSVIVIPSSLAIAAVALYWTYDRFQLSTALTDLGLA